MPALGKYQLVTELSFGEFLQQQFQLFQRYVSRVVLEKAGDLLPIHGRAHGVRCGDIENQELLFAGKGQIHGSPENGGHSAVHYIGFPGGKSGGGPGQGTQPVEACRDGIGLEEDRFRKGSILESGLEDLMAVVQVGFAPGRHPMVLRAGADYVELEWNAEVSDNALQVFKRKVAQDQLRIFTRPHAGFGFRVLDDADPRGFQLRRVVAERHRGGGGDYDLGRRRPAGQDIHKRPASHFHAGHQQVTTNGNRSLGKAQYRGFHYRLVMNSRIAVVEKDIQCPGPNIHQ